MLGGDFFRALAYHRIYHYFLATPPPSPRDYSAGLSPLLF
jgi:hypothetical protein